MTKSIVITGDDIKISDGYHTFDELYAHRIELWITLCRVLSWDENPVQYESVWRSKTHSDGTQLASWFVLGVGISGGKQMTYHLPLYKWDECDFAETRVTAPEFDGHTSADVLERLKQL